MEEKALPFILDPYPQQTPEWNQLHKFYEYLREGRITSTKCKDCGCLPWPPKSICPECKSSNLEWVDLPEPRRVFAYTVGVYGMPPQFPLPLILAVIKCGENGVRLISRIVDTKPEDIKVGMEVELNVINIPGDRVMFTFKPKS